MTLPSHNARPSRISGSQLDALGMCNGVPVFIHKLSILVRVVADLFPLAGGSNCRESLGCSADKGMNVLPLLSQYLGTTSGLDGERHIVQRLVTDVLDDPALLFAFQGSAAENVLV